MIAATSSQRLFGDTKLMIIRNNEAKNIEHALFSQLNSLICPNDLLVINNSGTIPGSFKGMIERSGENIEIRLAAYRGNHSADLRYWTAVAFGAGDWRVTTEDRRSPPATLRGDRIFFSNDLSATIIDKCLFSGRVSHIEFHSPRLVASLFENGRPIQYSYLKEELHVWDQQTIFSGPPISVEPPSSAFPFTWQQMLQLMQKGIQVSPITHSAGLSSTGDPRLDALLPFEEFYDVPLSTVSAIERTRALGGRVIAVGTSVVRALETAYRLEPELVLTGRTSLKLGRESHVKVVDSLITGMHEEGTSHAELLRAFCDEPVLRRAQVEAEGKRYRSHEYGDSTWLDRG